jgi:hypothetical protein
MKLQKIENSRIGEYDFMFDCPGCNYSHGIMVKKEGYSGPTWDFNNDLNKPTVFPSINHTMMSGDILLHRCHSFIRDGFIQFLDDCTHSLKGTTVELPEL